MQHGVGSSSGRWHLVGKDEGFLTHVCFAPGKTEIVENGQAKSRWEGFLR